jgi:hypothetical protein
MGTPLRAEIEARAPERLEEARDAAAAALGGLAGQDVPMSALVVSARSL